MQFKGKTFLVTGGAGFIGSHTTKALIDKGARVIIIDNLSTGKKENAHPKATFYKMDLADAKLKGIFEKEKPEYVYHFAFNVLVPKSIEDPLMDAQSIIASLNLLKNAHEFNIKKVVFPSSGFLYGNNPDLPVVEDQPVDPTNPYVVSKQAVENYLRFYNRTFGLPYVIFRYAAIYGPGQVTGAMADYVRKLRADSQAEIWGDGTKTRDYVFIDDVIRANLLALEIPDTYKNPLFNIGTGKETTLNELYQLIATLLKKTPSPVYLPDRKGEQMRYSLDNSKIKKAFGWQPKVTLSQGIRKVLDFKQKPPTKRFRNKK